MFNPRLIPLLQDLYDRGKITIEQIAPEYQLYIVIKEK